jgi:Protein of unknown function (DUF3987)
MMTYNIREHLAVLTPSKAAKTKYHCPVCNGRNLDIHPQTGEYGCFTSNCEPKDIRAAIDKLEGKPEWKPERDDWQKTVRPKSQQEYFYPDLDGNPLIKVVRIDDGRGGKNFYQSHWNGHQWVKGTPTEIRANIHIYRYQQIKQAIEQGRSIFWVEGEDTADRLWALDIPATTTIGGSGGYGSYGNYQDDVKGARLVLAPDRDSNGLKYIANIERDFPNQIEGYYLAGAQALWKNPQGGMDIGDDIQDLGMNQEQISAKAIAPEIYSKITNIDQQSNNPTIDIRQQLEDLVNTDLERSEIEIRLTQLGKNGKDSVCALRKILNEIEAEADRDEQRPELKIEVDRLTTAKSTSVNIRQQLPTSLAKPIEMLAKSLGHNVEPYLLYLLAGTGGVLHSESFIQLRTGYQQPGNLYGGVIAASGSMKSPVQKQMLTKPLAKLQQEYNERHAQEWAQYEIDAESWKPDSGEPKPIAPHHHVVYTNNMTMEAVDVIAAKQPQQSAIYIKDELKAIFMSANQYRQGDDMQTYLSRYDGEQLSRIRAGSGFITSNHEIKFTMVGTIQPGVISELSDTQDDDDGLMSRFLFSNLNCQFVPMVEKGGVDIVDLIANTYSKVHKLPATIYKLNSEAFKKFAVEFDRLRINSLDTSRKGWERNVWSKAGGQLGRLILNLHLIWLVNDSDYFQKSCQHCQQTGESVPSQGVDLSTNVSTNCQQLSTLPILKRIDPMDFAVQAKIPPETVERAIELIRYFVDQSIGLIADQSGELSPQLARILELSRKKGSITPRLIIHSINGKNRPANTRQAIVLLKELAEMGYGKLEQRSRIFVFTPNSVDSVDNLLTSLLTTQTDTPIDLEPVVDNVDTLSNLSTNEKFFMETDPQPPTIDRPIPYTTKVNDDVEYLVVDGEVKFLEIFFQKQAIAKDWKNQVTLWGCQTSDLEQRNERKGNKWLLIVKELTVTRLEQLLAADLRRSPQQPSRR